MKNNMKKISKILMEKNLTTEKFDTLMKKIEKKTKQVEEKEGAVYEFDYYSYTDKDYGFIKAFKIYDDNTYSITIVDEFHKDVDDNINYLYA